MQWSLSQLKCLQFLVGSALRARYNPSKRTVIDVTKYTRDDLRLIAAKLVEDIANNPERQAELAYFNSIIKDK